MKEEVPNLFDCSFKYENAVRADGVFMKSSVSLQLGLLRVLQPCSTNGKWTCIHTALF